MIAQAWFDFLFAVQFMTRVPIHLPSYSEDALPRAAKFFPLVGLFVGGSAAMLYLLLDSHLPRLAAAARRRATRIGTLQSGAD